MWSHDGKTQMSPGDKALERIISEITTALSCVPDARLVKLQQIAVGMRSREQVEHMERAKGVAGARKGEWGVSRWR